MLFTSKKATIVNTFERIGIPSCLSEIRWYWLILAMVTITGLILRLYLLKDICLWYDETQVFSSAFYYGDLPQSLRSYAAAVA